MSGQGARYVYPPLERRGLLLGLERSQLAALCMGALAALVLLRAFPTFLGLMAGAVEATGVTAVACLPLRDKPLLKWAVVAWRWYAATALSRFPFKSAQSMLQGRSCSGDMLYGPRRIGRLRISEEVTLKTLRGHLGEREIGAMADSAKRTLSAVIRADGEGFALDGIEGKRLRVEAWGRILSGLARHNSPVVALQWVVVKRPAKLEAEVSHIDGRDTHGIDLRDDYRELLRSATEDHGSYETMLVLVVDARTTRRLLRRSLPLSWGKGTSRRMGETASSADILRRELRLFESQLKAAGFKWKGVLDTAELTAALTSGWGTGTSLSSLDPWPSAVDERWSSVRTEALWHATYWVAEWPRVEVGPDFLSTLLIGGKMRSTSVVMAPIPPDRAAREVESARTADMADEQLRMSAGFITTARRASRSRGVVQREVELAEGHADYVFSGYISVAALDEDGLEEACSELEQEAGAAHLILRKLYGQQMDALTWVMPIGRGLP